MDTGCRENPFSSHRIEPALGGYIFPVGTDLPHPIVRLEKWNWRGELVGPHGSGKSTLLTDICNELTRQKITWARWQCSDSQRLLPANWLQDVRRAEVLCIDGAESLIPGLLWLVRFQTRMRGHGLIVTLHKSVGLGAQIPVEPQPASLNTKLKSLGFEEPTDTTAARLNRHGGNAREVLFELYGEYEQKQKGGPAGVQARL